MIKKLFGFIPPEVRNLPNLVEFDINNILIGPIPHSIGNLEMLTLLHARARTHTHTHTHIYNNQLSGLIPITLGTLTNQTFLHLYNNNLSGTIPKE